MVPEKARRRDAGNHDFKKIPYSGGPVVGRIDGKTKPPGTWVVGGVHDVLIRLSPNANKLYLWSRSQRTRDGQLITTARQMSKKARIHYHGALKVTRELEEAGLWVRLHKGTRGHPSRWRVPPELEEARGEDNTDTPSASSASSFDVHRASDCSSSGVQGAPIPDYSMRAAHHSSENDKDKTHSNTLHLSQSLGGEAGRKELIAALREVPGLRQPTDVADEALAAGWAIPDALAEVREHCASSRSVGAGLLRKHLRDRDAACTAGREREEAERRRAAAAAREARREAAVRREDAELCQEYRNCREVVDEWAANYYWGRPPWRQLSGAERLQRWKHRPPNQDVHRADNRADSRNQKSA